MIRFRTARPRDIAPCVRFIGEHPVLGPRYGPAIEHLAKIWGHFLGADALVSLVSEEAGAEPALIGAHMACFVSDEFAAEIATPPFKWIGPAIIDCFLGGRSPLLTDEELRSANSTGGVNLMVWPTAPRAEFENYPELLRMSQNLFFDTYRGFNIKRAQTQSIDAKEMTVAVNSGSWYLRDTALTPTQSFDEPVESVVLQPHLLETTRKMAEQQPGTWLNLLFAYCKPVLGLARSEQRLLSAALKGGTDEELSDVLDVSLSAVKKMWASIYLRVHLQKCGNVGIDFGESVTRDRGKEKKQKLLAYLREHPEELRPYSLKLVKNSP
jgi:hypothetical protein